MAKDYNLEEMQKSRTGIESAVEVVNERKGAFFAKLDNAATENNSKALTDNNEKLKVNLTEFLKGVEELTENMRKCVTITEKIDEAHNSI